MKKFLLLMAMSFLTCGSYAKEQKREVPNVVIIYADDLGFGDVGAYGSIGLKTPNMDKIANEGVRFSNAYASSATCTPSRYSLLTGEYPWRNERAQVLQGDAPLLISTTQMTLPKMMQNSGYITGVVGKWHLGMGNGNTDWNNRISPGPNEVGFDYSYVMAATNDRVPNVFVKNGTVEDLDESDPLEVSYKKNFEGEPTGRENPELLKVMYSHGHDMSINNGVSRIGFQRGGKSAQWVDEEMSDIFLREAKQFIDRNQDHPFFLLYNLHQPHVPRIPHPRFAGTTGLGARGDVIAEADWCIGELLKSLERRGLMENTIIIFSSDNGPVLDDGYMDASNEKLGDHKPSGPFRGGKYSLYEAGTHVPLMVMWKGNIKPKVSNALISQVDIMASCAALTNQEIPKSDGQNLLRTLKGETLLGRKSVVIEGLFHRVALRADDWVYIPSYKGGSKPGWGVDVETGFSSCDQLYNLNKDPQQLVNMALKFPEKLKQMKKLLIHSVKENTTE
ncbi:MAG: arylsulfatase [Bacteroidales bacterium]|nr:MAG: arylsulfatase [Bacteroidales bacterium]